jgi:hypothetical protein
MRCRKIILVIPDARESARSGIQMHRHHLLLDSGFARLALRAAADAPE